MSKDLEATKPQLSVGIVKVFAAALIAAGIAALAYMLYFSLYVGRRISTEPDAWGQFGDYFGGVMNPIIALAALGLLAVGVRIQNDTLREAKKQLNLQRAELEQTRAVLSKQSEQLQLQAEAAQREVFEATFFRLMEALRRLTESFEATSRSRGIGAMFEWAVQLRDHAHGQLRSRQLAPDGAASVLASWYPTHRPKLSSYFALVLMTLEFIEKNNRSDAIFYTDILRATFSPGELFLLFHYGVGESGNHRFKALAEKYGLLEAFDPEDFDLPGERRLWYSARRISRDYTAKLATLSAAEEREVGG